MALHITVNGKFGEACGKRRGRLTFLDDPERVKKDLETERRITRLKQVREKSNSLARRIRQEVAEEKSRQLKKLEHIKQEELNAWKHHVLVKKHNDYRTAIFQVGAAHRAAQAENESTELHKRQRAERIKKCRRQAASAKSIGKPSLTPVQLSNCEGRATAGTQTPLPDTTEKDKENSRLDAGYMCTPTCNKSNCQVLGTPRICQCAKRKRPVCCRENPNCLCESSEEEWLSDTSLDQSDVAITSETTCNPQNLQRTPPVILDVDNQSDESLEYPVRCRGLDINDHFAQQNRQFSRVVRASSQGSPDRAPQVPPTTARQDRGGKPRFTQISDLLGGTKESPIRPQPEEVPPTAASRSPRKAVPSQASGSPTRAMTSPTRAAPTDTRQPSKASKKKITKEAPRSPQQRARPRAVPTSQPAPAKIINAGIRRSQPSSTAAAVPMPTTTASTAPAFQQQLLVLSQPMQQTQPQQMQAPTNSPAQYPVDQQAISMLPPAQTQYSGPQQVIPMPIPAQTQYPGTQHVAAIPLPAHSMSQYPYQHQQPPLPMPSQAGYIIGQQPMQPEMPTYAGQYPPQVSALSQPVHPQQAAPAPSQITASQQSSISTTTFVLRQNQASSSGTAPGTRVQFYDYNNKYHRHYEAPSQAVQATAQERSALTAMDQARMENQLAQLRELEAEKLRKITDQRGQKALEREQVRRDCAELTEKLDALTQKNPQLLPSDTNFIASHRFADLAARRQEKMNEAMEQMLLRPAVITCPEVELPTTSSKQQQGKQTSCRSAPIAVNVGETQSRPGDDSVSATSESCCSILLDYVNDQSKQLRNELKTSEANTAKSEKLKSLLNRIEKLREQLLDEIKAGAESSKTNVASSKAHEVINSIRQEREDILEDKARTLEARESNLHEKEVLLERRLREFFKTKTAAKVKDKAADKPVEIVIKVRSDGSIRPCISKNKTHSKTSSKSSKPSLLQEPVFIEEEANSGHDSNSTAYRSLPPVINSAKQQSLQPLHPLIAHYIQRLLGMTHSSIQALSVSTSDVPTPGSSIINNSRNISPCSTTDEHPFNEQRVERVKAFIAENRSFIDELEESLRQNSENSMRAFDQIWTKRLETANAVEKSNATAKEPSNTVKRVTPRGGRSAQTSPARRSVTIAEPEQLKTAPSTTQQSISTKSVRQTNKNNNIRSVSMRTFNAAQSVQNQRQLVPTAEQPKSGQFPESGTTDATRQMERYARLTENCTQRIAELTDLITKVREEKQRLVEVTLTSASDAERHSTEYLELPNREIEIHSRTVSERSEVHTTPTTSEVLPLSDQEPLQKHKPTGASRDSGISVSRPVTAQETHLPEADPNSLTSSTQSSTAAQRRSRAPPASLHRYSPHMVEEDPAHELSTIAEVDTPAQSHITGPGENTLQRREPVPFPTFEQYAQEMNLDLTHIDADQSYRLQREFDELVQAAIIENRAGVSYQEFPTINAYLHNLANSNVNETQDRTTTVQDVVQTLRVANISIRAFPPRREYLEQRLAQQPPDERALIDSASLENLTDDSFNVQAELRQRRILKSSYREIVGAPTTLHQEVASSTRRGSGLMTEAPNESGIERLSTSPGGTLSSDMDREMQRLGLNWPATMRQRQRQAAAMNADDTTDHSSVDASGRTCGGRSTANFQEATIAASQLGRSLNLREFLTRELLKHRVQLDKSVDTSDESLKSNFLQSVLDSLTASSNSLTHTPQTGTGLGQKTSTPVGSLRSPQDKSVSRQHTAADGTTALANTQMFSGESHISSVHYPDGTPPVKQQPQPNKAPVSSKTPRSPRTNAKGVGSSKSD